MNLIRRSSTGSHCHWKSFPTVPAERPPGLESLLVATVQGERVCFASKRLQIEFLASPAKMISECRAGTDLEEHYCSRLGELSGLSQQGCFTSFHAD